MAIPEYVMYMTRIKTFEYPSYRLRSPAYYRVGYGYDLLSYELSKPDYDYMLKVIRNKFLKFVKKLKLNKINPFFVKQDLIRKIFYPKTGKKKNKKMFHCSDGSFFWFFDLNNPNSKNKLCQQEDIKRF